MAHQIELTRKAVRQLGSLPSDVQSRLKPRIDALASNPRPRGVKKLSAAEGIYRIREGDYRIIYQVQDNILLVLVLRIGHRKDVYRPPLK